MNLVSLSEFGELDPETAEAVATADATPTPAGTPKVVGKGVYLELVNANNTTQILLTPAGIDENGKAVEMAITTRTVSEWSPRRQWRVSFFRLNAEKSKGTTAEKIAEFSEQVERMLTRQMMYGAGTLRNNTPIVVELTNFDLTEIGEWKPPASALRRITKARTALGFPTDLFPTA